MTAKILVTEPRPDHRGHVFKVANDGNQSCLICFADRKPETEQDLCPKRYRPNILNQITNGPAAEIGGDGVALTTAAEPPDFERWLDKFAQAVRSGKLTTKRSS